MKNNNLHLIISLKNFLFAFVIGIIGTKSAFAQYPEGSIHGAFSVSDSTYVFFSQGNLQYIGSASTPYWKFADNQWDCLGTTTGQNSSDQNVDRDLFGWGTSGYNHGATCYQPWSTSSTNSQYYAYGSSSYNLFDQTGQADWGYNAISNGGDQENSGWRTLKKDEWNYLYNTRSTPSGIRFAKAKVNNVNGMILLPDDWSASYYSLSNANSTGASFTSNSITSAQWNTLEQHGAVFLPAAGYRYSGASVASVGAYGDYWSSTRSDNDHAYVMSFGGSVGTDYSYYRYSGRSVRLVCPAYSLSINVIPRPAEGGAVSGAGAYSVGAVCTLTATPSAGYDFAFWSEKGILISTDTTYSFTVLRERNLVANYVVTGSNIVFADANVKALCVANWDTNGDGELTYYEAALVTSLETVFKNNTNINTFNELQYFIGLSSIGSQAFYGCTGLTQITIPENVTSVEGKAFWNCPNLQTVYFNAINCTSMQTTYNNTTYSVFSSDGSGSASALTRVVIGSNVTRIPDYAFKSSVDIYQRLVIPASVNRIGSYAFYDCNSMVQMVIQGNGLQTIGQYAFYGCSALRSALNLPNSVTTVGQYAFYGCLLIPSLTIGEGVVTIGGYAFWNCPALVTVHFNATNCTTMNTNSQYSVFNTGISNGGATPIVTLTIGENVTVIPSYAFKNSPNATGNLPLPNGLTYIGYSAFSSCSGFTGDLTIPNSVASIGHYAFSGCSGFNGTLTLPVNDSYTIINQYTFNGCSSLTGTLTIPTNVTELSHSAFSGCCSFTGALVLHDEMTTIDQYVFFGCSGIPELTIGESINTIGAYAFWNCPALSTVHFNATNCTTMNTDSQYSVFNTGISNGGATPIVTLTIGENVTVIPDYAFRNSTSMTSIITIPDATTSIGTSAFYGANSTELTIGTGVTSIGHYAFWYCPNLATVHFNATNCTQMCTRTGTSASNYQYYSVFNSSTSIGGATPIATLTIGENVTVIPDYAFRNSTSMTSIITIPDATTSIGTYAFYGAKSTELTIGAGVTSIGYYAFWYCPNLATVHFNATNCTQMCTRTGTSASNIQYYSVFNSGTSNGGATPIVTLTIGENVTIIPAYAFKHSSNMTCDLIIPDAVTSIGLYAFADCSGHNVIIGNGVINIDSYAFYQSSGINGTLLLGDALTCIGSYAFQGCSGFTGDLVIPNSVTTLGQYAFQGCSSFDGSLIIGSGVQTINQYTFADCSGFLGSLIVGRQVNSIGDFAFNNCSGFTVLISENPTPPTAVDNSFQSMNFSIPLYVPYGMMPAYQNAAGWSQFTNRIEQYVFDLLDNDLWSDEMNWYAFELPGPTDVVCVNSNCHMDMDANVLHLYVLNLNDVLTINNGMTLTTTYGVGTLQPSQLIIENGGQLVNTISNAYGTVMKQINGYGMGDDGWYTIATPVYGGTAVSGLTTGSYDLYSYDEPAAMWRNQKEESDFNRLNPAQGYLYAKQTATTLNLTGQLNASNAAFSVPVTRQNSFLPGFNLLGNPYTNNINIGSVAMNNTPFTSYYKAVGGSQLVAYTDADNDAIRPGDGFFVQVAQDDTVYFNTPMRQEKGSYVRLVLSKDGHMTDRAYLRMNEGATLDKAFVEGHPSLLYFSNDGQFQAVAHSGSEAYGIYFEPIETGTYAIESSLLNAECNYLHLIDKFTGNDIDLLIASHYQFEASSTDNPDRFALVLAPDAIPAEAPIVIRNRDGIPTLPSHGSDTAQSGYGADMVYIAATANPAEGGTVTGMGNHPLGATAVLTAIANEGYTFVNWTKNGTEVSTSATYSFTVTEAATLVANFVQNQSTLTQATALSEGWSWWSSYIEQNNNNGLEQLEESLGENGIMIKSRNAFVSNYGTSWIGLLENISNENTYLIQTNATCNVSVSGYVVSPSAHPITLPSGWSWIGYPCHEAMSVNTALSSLSPMENDQLKSREGLAVYYPGAGWIGSLQTITPGMGLMFESHSTASVTLTYPEASKMGSLAENITARGNHWEPVMHPYPYNMSVIAIVERDGQILQDDQYELAVFSGNECRGSARLIYVEPIDRFVAFLTVYGEEATEMVFGLYDIETGEECFDSDNILHFEANGTVGSLREPMVVSFRGTTGLDEWNRHIALFPNPVERGQNLTIGQIEGNLGAVRIEVVNALGAVIDVKVSATLPANLTAPSVPGVYTLRLVVEGKGTGYRKFIVK